MIVDDIVDSYLRFIKLCSNSTQESNQELILQKISYIVFRIRELCSEIDDFSNQMCTNNINNLTDEQIEFYENMNYTNDMIKNVLPLLIARDINLNKS